MKKLLFVAALCLGFTFAAEAQVNFGVGAALGLERGGVSDDFDTKLGIGVNLRALFNVANKIDVAPQLTYWFATAPDPETLTYAEVSGNVHYNFSQGEDTMNFYGLAGLNLGYIKAGVDGGESASDTEIGLNIGAGLRSGSIYAEVMYATNWEDISVVVGYYF